MEKRPTQRDIAHAAGVSAMTVSLALRGHSSIPPSTRTRIRQIAEKLGYRPDPALAALNAYRLQGRKKVFQGSLVWLTCFPTAAGWREMIHAEGYFEGARRRAEELGYILEDFWFTEPRLSPKRAAQVLMARGVKGIIVAPLPPDVHDIRFEWRHFPAISLGYSMRTPQLNVVMNHQARNMRETVRQLHRLGYQRIGLAMPSTNNERVDQNYLGGYLVSQRDTPTKLEPLLAADFRETVFRKWLRKQKPDAVVISPAWLDQVTTWLGKEELSVPKDIGLAAPSIIPGHPLLSGMNEDLQMIGGMAVNALVGMIHHREFGIPEQAWSLLAEGRWTEGKSTRAISSRK